MSDQYKILEDSRSAAITSAANFLEGVAKVKRIARRFDHPTGARPAPPTAGASSASGDFLFDLLRLNATYLNKLAQLGQAHGDLAHRALENLYSRLVPSAPPTDSIKVIFTPQIPVRSIHIPNFANSLKTPILLEWAWVQERATKLPVDWIANLHPGTCKRDPASATSAASLKATGDAIEVRVRADLDAFEAHRKYETEIVVTTGKFVRRIPVVLDLSAPKDG